MVLDGRKIHMEPQCLRTLNPETPSPEPLNAEPLNPKPKQRKLESHERYTATLKPEREASHLYPVGSSFLGYLLLSLQGSSH